MIPSFLLALPTKRYGGRGRTLVLVTLLWLLHAAPAGATHIVGGQLQMTHTQNTEYQFNLTLYFDDINGSTGAIDQSVKLATYDKQTNQLVETLTLWLIGQTPIAYTNPACQTSASPLRTSQLDYEEFFTLNAARYTSPGGYYLVWERCCRNNIITNIDRPGEVGQAFYLEFQALQRNGQRFINSTPGSFEPVRDLACAMQPFRAPFGGVDPDGDSLVYDLVDPLIGHSSSADVIPNPPYPAPYATVGWLTGYGVNQQIKGPQPLVVDRRTGEIAFTADQEGLYVFAVRCSEYRAGVKIGEVRREFQQKVISCNTDLPPVLALTQPSTTGQAIPYVPGTVLTLPDPPANRCLTLRAADGERDSRLTLSLVAPGVPLGTVLPSLSVTGGTVNPSGRRDTLVAQLCFDQCYGLDGAALRLALIVTDQACPLPQRDTVWLTVQARAIPDTPPTLTFATGAPAAGYTVTGGTHIEFDFTGTDVDFDSRVSVRGIDIDTGPLAGLGITVPRRTGDGTATTRLTWDVGCDVPAGDYLLHLQAQSEACSRALTVDTLVRVTVLAPDTSQLLPPNIITPNNDGLNDRFQPAAGVVPGCGVEFRRLRIFTRWGREVFASTDRLAVWNAEQVAGGMYFYFLEYSNRTYKGWVEVMQ